MNKSHPARRNPGRPKKVAQKNQVDTESMILHHAGLLFMKSGYAAVSMNAITKEVGITKPTLYHYFPDKEHLYTAVLCHRLVRIGKEIITVIDGEGTVREKLFGLAYGFFRFASMSMSSLMRDVEAQLRSTLISQVYDTYDQWIIDPHKRLFLEGMKQGELKEPQGQVKVLVDLWLGLLDALAQRGCQDHERLVELSQTVVTVFMDGVARK